MPAGGVVGMGQHLDMLAVTWRIDEHRMRATGPGRCEGGSSTMKCSSMAVMRARAGCVFDATSDGAATRTAVRYGSRAWVLSWPAVTAGV